MVEKLKAADLSAGVISNNQSFGEISIGSENYDWTLQVDLRSATNLSSRQADLTLPSPFVEVSWSPELQYERSGDTRQFSDSC